MYLLTGPTDQTDRNDPKSFWVPDYGDSLPHLRRRDFEEFSPVDRFLLEYLGTYLVPLYRGLPWYTTAIATGTATSTSTAAEDKKNTLPRRRNQYIFRINGTYISIPPPGELRGIPGMTMHSAGRGGLKLKQPRRSKDQGSGGERRVYSALSSIIDQRGDWGYYPIFHG